MGRTRFGVAEPLGREEVTARQRAARDPVERDRWQMIRLLVAGRSLREVAEATGSSTRWVRAVVRRYNADGPDGPADRRHANPGAAPLLDADGRAALEAALAQPPPAGGADGPAPRWRRGSPGAPSARRCRCSAAGSTRGGPGPARRSRARSMRAGGRRVGTSRLSKRLNDAAAEERARHPGTPVEVWACDEHRAGLKPVIRRVWAKRGRRPVAVAEPPRYDRLHLYGFVRPTTGAVEWFLCTTANTAPFAAVPARFAAAVGAGPDERVILVLDGAGWHGGGRLAPPEGLRLEFLPPYSPELQPAERLWPLTNEAIANRHFASLAELDAALAARCLALADQSETIKAHTSFRWWPEAA